mgnify:CR=1 FL=1
MKKLIHQKMISTWKSSTHPSSQAFAKLEKRTVILIFCIYFSKIIVKKLEKWNRDNRNNEMVEKRQEQALYNRTCQLRLPGAGWHAEGLERSASAQRFSLSWWLRSPEEFNLFGNHIRNASFVASLKDCYFFTFSQFSFFSHFSQFRKYLRIA